MYFCSSNTSNLLPPVATISATANMAELQDVNIFAQMAQVQLENSGLEVDSLLEQLANEPNNEEELLAKFQLFETFLETVTLLREQTLKFWNENSDQFVGAVFDSCQRDIQAIDSNEALGIYDDDRKWFVFLMTKRANQNSKLISQTLAKLRGRLELLAQELHECPFCLDQLVVDRYTVLGFFFIIIIMIFKFLFFFIKNIINKKFQKFQINLILN
jgi:hypothetical protein